MIRVHTLTEATGEDATTALDLLTAVEGPFVRVTADAAYDTVAVYETARARGATVVIPPGVPRFPVRFNLECADEDGVLGTSIREAVCRILEGGKDAFRQREHLPQSWIQRENWEFETHRRGGFPWQRPALLGGPIAVSAGAITASESVTVGFSIGVLLSGHHAKKPGHAPRVPSTATPTVHRIIWRIETGITHVARPRRPRRRRLHGEHQDLVHPDTTAAARRGVQRRNTSPRRRRPRIVERPNDPAYGDARPGEGTRRRVGVEGRLGTSPRVPWMTITSAPLAMSLPLNPSP